MSFDREYGSRGRVGVSTPQANPVVEPEMSALLPAGVSLLVSRLVCAEPDQRLRFTAYMENLGDTLKSYDILKPEVLGFACTASSYVVGPEREKRLIDGVSEAAGYPIITGGQAIIAAMQSLGIKRVAVAAPYPQWVLDESHGYYAAAGFQVVTHRRIETRTTDTRTIYELSSRDGLAAARGMDVSSADALLFTGTGMPTLAAIEALGDLGIPVLSTNICLPWAVSRSLGVTGAEGAHPLLNGWQERVKGL
jgi:maleate isomerase